MIALPAQPTATEWPSTRWPQAAPGPDVDVARLQRALDHAFATSATEDLGETHTTVVIHRGNLVAERYAEGKGPDDSFPSWSVAKSILHACVGIAVRDGKLDARARADVPAWSGRDDPRRELTLDHLLHMSSGLGFVEDYVDTEGSDVIHMLFGAGKADVAAYATAKPLAHAPGSVWSYSSGTSNIIAALLGRAMGVSGESYRAFLFRELFDPLGMRSADPRFDEAGTWIASSFLFARARDFARFGLLYLRDGIWEGRRLLPQGWVDYARTPAPACETREYGAHWWLATDGSATFSANGYRGQFIVISPERDLVVVRHGASPPELRGAVYRYLREILHSFPLLGA